MTKKSPLTLNLEQLDNSLNSGTGPTAAAQGLDQWSGQTSQIGPDESQRKGLLGGVQRINAFSAPPEEEDLGFGETMVRQDLSQLKMPATPKNEIALIRLT